MTEVKVLEKEKNELKIEVEGEGHTFCNVVQKALLKDDRVELAGYNIPHPLIASPIIYVRTKGRGKPEAVLRDAAKEVLKNTKEFRKSFEKALRSWKEPSEASGRV